MQVDIDKGDQGMIQVCHCLIFQCGFKLDVIECGREGDGRNGVDAGIATHCISEDTPTWLSNGEMLPRWMSREWAHW